MAPDPEEQPQEVPAPPLEEAPSSVSWSERTLWLAARAPIITALAGATTAFFVILTFVLLPPQVQRALQEAKRLSEAREKHLMEQDNIALEHARLILMLANTETNRAQKEAAKLDKQNASLTAINDAMAKSNRAMGETRARLTNVIALQRSRLKEDQNNISATTAKLTSMSLVESRERVLASLRAADEDEGDNGIIIVDDPTLYADIRRLSTDTFSPLLGDSWTSPIEPQYRFAEVSETDLRFQQEEFSELSNTDQEKAKSDDDKNLEQEIRRKNEPWHLNLLRTARILCEHRKQAMTLLGELEDEGKCKVIFSGQPVKSAFQVFMELLVRNVTGSERSPMLGSEVSASVDDITTYANRLHWKGTTSELFAAEEKAAGWKEDGGDDIFIKTENQPVIELYAAGDTYGDAISYLLTDIDTFRKIVGTDITQTEISPDDNILRTTLEYAPLACVDPQVIRIGSFRSKVVCRRWSEEKSRSSTAVFARAWLGEQVVKNLVSKALEEMDLDTKKATRRILGIESSN